MAILQTQIAELPDPRKSWRMFIRIGPVRLRDIILEIADEERSRGENQRNSNFSDTVQVKSARCNLLFF